MKDIIKVITIDDFKKYQPSWSSSFEDLQIQDGINLATNELIAFTNKLLEEVWEYNRANEGEIEKGNPLYRTEKELNSLELAVLSQTYFKLMYGNDNSIGDASYSGAGVSISQSMSEHSYIAPDVYQHLIDARLFKKEVKHEANKEMERPEPWDIIRNYPDPVYVPSKFDTYKIGTILAIGQNGNVIQSGLNNLIGENNKILYTNENGLTQWKDINEILPDLEYIKDVKVNGTSAKVDNQNVNIVIDGENGIEVKQHANHLTISGQGTLDNYAKKDLSNTRGFKSLNVYATNEPTKIVQNTTLEGINESYLVLNDPNPKAGTEWNRLTERLALKLTSIDIVEGGETLKAPSIVVDTNYVQSRFSGGEGLDWRYETGQHEAILDLKLDIKDKCPLVIEKTAPFGQENASRYYHLGFDVDTFNKNYKIKKVVDWTNQLILNGSISGSTFTYTNNSDNDYFLQGAYIQLISDSGSWLKTLINDRLLADMPLPGNRKGFGYSSATFELAKGETIKVQWDGNEVKWNDYINNVPVLRAYPYKYVLEEK